MSVRCLKFNIFYFRTLYCAVRTIWGSSRMRTHTPLKLMMLRQAILLYHVKKPPWNASKRLIGGERGIRTLVCFRTNWFRVSPVMTTSISLRMKFVKKCSYLTRTLLLYHKPFENAIPFLKKIKIFLFFFIFPNVPPSSQWPLSYSTDCVSFFCKK